MLRAWSEYASSLPHFLVQCAPSPHHCKLSWLWNILAAWDVFIYFSFFSDQHPNLRMHCVAKWRGWWRATPEVHASFGTRTTRFWSRNANRKWPMKTMRSSKYLKKRKNKLRNHLNKSSNQPNAIQTHPPSSTNQPHNRSFLSFTNQQEQTEIPWPSSLSYKAAEEFRARGCPNHRRSRAQA